LENSLNFLYRTIWWSRKKFTTRIKNLRLGFSTKIHIGECEKEWRGIEYHDKRIWPRVFSKALEDVAYK
jgi:hypothetical protein